MQKISYSLDYLGYNITFGNGPIKLRLTKNKLDKYQHRIDLIFDNYFNYSKVNEKKARKLLVKRVRFLTGNTRLLNNKRDVLVGIYFSNSLLTDISDLDVLDNYLNTKKNAMIKTPNLRQRLDKLTFREGFEQKRFSLFSTVELSKITKVWKNET